ncbi:hypothetical protein [Azospirillum tabaci]|uniref:hypothetical protein n=1 Tax=Azospirillum tabaci TaxID=2752310 RepID=UPI0016616810|nr:hypothetical protein [Azospirillum tabaci]
MLIGSDHITHGRAVPGESAALPALSARLAASLADLNAAGDRDAYGIRREIAQTIAATVPVTPADAIAVVSLLTNPEIGLEIGQDKLHLTAARSLEAGLRAMAANETITDTAATFNETAALFAEAGRVKLPAEPTDCMVAAAEQAGVDPERFRAGYRAAVAAFLLEAA